MAFDGIEHAIFEHYAEAGSYSVLNIGFCLFQCFALGNTAGNFKTFSDESGFFLSLAKDEGETQFDGSFHGADRLLDLGF